MLQALNAEMDLRYAEQNEAESKNVTAVTLAGDDINGRLRPRP